MTHNDPTYEGRPLARPGEEVVDQGLGFDISTLLSRRRILRLLGAGAATAGLAACTTTQPSGTTTEPSTNTTSTTTGGAATEEIPEETAGPYPGDGSNGPDVLEQNGIVRSDIRSSFGGASGTAEGVPMTLELVVANVADGGSAYAGVAVYVWHCSREGGYSMYSEGVENENFLRGVQIADATGKVSFTSIFPACYAGRWPHVHFEIAVGSRCAVVVASSAVVGQPSIEDGDSLRRFLEPIRSLLGIPGQSEFSRGEPS